MEEQQPDRAEEERPREDGEWSSGPRQDVGATTRWNNEEKRSLVANWSELMQWTTLDSRASVERPVLQPSASSLHLHSNSDIEKYTATVLADCYA